MARIQVRESNESTPVPFLRGILTRSLQVAGLSFNEAYELASAIRDDLVGEDLDEITEITTDELRTRVINYLERFYNADIVNRYRSSARVYSPILVRDDDGATTTFSRAHHRRLLESISLPPDQATQVTSKMYDHLLSRKVAEISSRYLGELTYRCLYQDRDFGPAVARRYLLWTEFLRSGRPLILLLGGTAGCGKSTIATELANRLEVVRTQSTDGLREVMRMMLPQRLVPVLHSSSFKAWEALPRGKNDDDKETLLADGYRTQAELLSVACEAVIQRAFRERVSLILEGVHIHPFLLERIPKDNDAIVVPIMLAVLKPDQLRARLRGRTTEAPQRRSERYLENFDGIWSLQSFLLSEADKAKIPIVPNDNKNKAIREVMRTTLSYISREFIPDPNKVFKTVVRSN